MVLCPYCQRDSRSAQVCDHCRALLPAGEGELPASVALPDGEVLDLSLLGGWPADCSRPMRVTSPAPLRVYALSRSWWRDLRAAVECRAALSLDCLAPVRVVPVGDGALVIADALPGAASPLPGDCSDELARVERTLEALRTLAGPMAELHRNGLVWLNFDPREIESAGGRVRLTNLDLLAFPAGAHPDAMRLSPDYSPSEVCGFEGEKFGPATDVFHLGMYAYYRLAGLLRGGFGGQGLESFDFQVPPLRVYRPGLPPGVAAVVARATARESEARFGTPAHLLAALELVVRGLRQRQAAPAVFAWDCSAATAIGRTHELGGMPNQDAFTMLSLDRGRSLYVVADGVSSCSVGAGELASQTGVEVLAEVLPELLREASTPAQIEAALAAGCARASEAILARALAENPPRHIDPSELMSSTVLIGYTHGATLSVACLGDSRAFLVAGGVAEQLTVDGDVRCVHLAHGVAPEQVRQMGHDAGALFACLGVSEPRPDGSLVRCALRTTPAVTHWRMRPGDVVVLATDGLVEEGVFLDPEDLPGLLGEGGPGAAARLVEGARARHRGASAWEPYGCGDDITCVVLRAGEVGEKSS